MTGSKFNVQPAAPGDRPVVRSLLAAARLPVEDLDQAEGRLTFWVARTADSGPVAAIGLERFGNVGLLRSLVVAPDQRLKGVGRELVHALEQHATATGLEELVLLTETAESFFRRLRYVVIERGLAPVAVAHSAEFRTLCPATAVCMRKRL
jgi:amino-acid N-acetyltransferase